MVGIQPQGRGDQLLARGVELRAGQPLRPHPDERRDNRDRPPLQLRRLRGEPELGGRPHEPLVKLAMNPPGDPPGAKPAGDQILDACAQPARHDQPRH